MRRRALVPSAATSLLVLALIALLSCRKREQAAGLPPSLLAPPASWSDAALLAEGTRYLDDGAFRRATLVASLTNPQNTYSRQRLDSYGLGTRGWDLLPVWNPQSLPVTTADAARLRAGERLALPATAPRLWEGSTRPATRAAWVELGRKVFFEYPLRVEVFMDFALRHPEVGERVGVRAGADGVYPGIRLFADPGSGTTALGITCAICHASVEGGAVVVGQARRSFDYGALRLAYHATTGAPVDADLARRMRSWGPGRADVTEDDDEDPVAIPDLWGLAHQSTLTQAGTIQHTGPAALAIRQETQLLHSNHQKVRPPRELAFALALYLYSLEPPSRRAAPADAEAATRGHALFDRHCASCHANPAGGGPAVPVERVGTDGSLARGHARGTGQYRTPTLLHVTAAAPYFHDGSVPTLADVLSPERLDPAYTRSAVPNAPAGAIPGHTFGTDLPATDRAALVSYLDTF